jgi:SNF2 family DNA or RNA helicase
MTKKERNFAMSFLPKLDDYVIIVNYEAWRRDKNLLEELGNSKFDTIIVDEAHMVKDPKTGAYKGVRQVIDACNPEYIIPMTGTPILNRPQELFWILTLVNPKDFQPTSGGERDFLWRYCEEYYLEDSSTPRYRFKAGGLDLLSKKIAKNFLRRTRKQAGIVLPEKTIMFHELERDDEAYPNQAKARKHMKEFATIVIDANAGKAIQATVMIALLTRLRQIETWPAGIVQRDKVTKEITLQLDVEESQKMDYIIRKEDNEWEGLIPNAIEDERIIVFSQFKAPLHELRRRVELMGYHAAVFDGDTPQNLRDEIRFDFDRSKQPEGYEPKYQVLLCNYKAAGVGLNLTGATQLITLDEEWNPGKREQAWDRIHRIGQTEEVTIHVVRTKKTVDTWLASIIDEKETVTTGFESAMLNVSSLKDALDSGLI